MIIAMEINEITEKVIGCAIEVHKALGSGTYWNQLMKNVYPLSCRQKD